MQLLHARVRDGRTQSSYADADAHALVRRGHASGHATVGYAHGQELYRWPCACVYASACGCLHASVSAPEHDYASVHADCDYVRDCEHEGRSGAIPAANTRSQACCRCDLSILARVLGGSGCRLISFDRDHRE